ncbi:hypothetical protein NE237_009757 [Protea cynaroides]|uniref:Uncharacterized protein n=1 Tax=Protea cynaroides TaxID=273540 RepID=A0A9Q0KYD5_9MAGN|nr:hypothetical protein NE237_009757 [Protea cynaroides]
MCLFMNIIKQWPGDHEQDGSIPFVENSLTRCDRSPLHNIRCELRGIILLLHSYCCYTPGTLRIDVEIHPLLRKQFWDSQHWLKHVLVRYTWLLVVFFPWGPHFTVFSGQISQVCKETVAESSMTGGGVAKVE